MALTLGTAYEQTKRKYHLKLLAGEEGMHRSLRWLYFLEDISIADFLRGGELMVITGFGFHGDKDFEDFVRMMIDRKACGVIVNVGKYIIEEEIPQSILDLCNTEKFPLITMPWKYHLSDILQDFSRQIFFRTHEQDKLTYIFQMLLNDEKLYSKEDETRLIANDFDPEGTYCAVVLSSEGTIRDAQLPELIRDMSIVAENHLNQNVVQVSSFTYHNELVLIFHQTDPAVLRAMVEQILALCRESFHQHQFYGGVGSNLAGVSHLKESYLRAQAALDYGKVGERSLVSFEEMGIYQLLFTCRDREVLDRFTTILQPLERYDSQFGSQLAETLRLYLKFNGSVNMVSDEMYCHRNTTNYRIKKIKSLLESDLDSRDVLFQLQLAFYVRDYQMMFDPK